MNVLRPVSPMPYGLEIPCLCWPSCLVPPWKLFWNQPTDHQSQLGLRRTDYLYSQQPPFPDGCGEEGFLSSPAGDNLTSIALRYGTTVNNILEINPRSPIQQILYRARSSAYPPEAAREAYASLAIHSISSSAATAASFRVTVKSCSGGLAFCKNSKKLRT